MGFLTLLTTLTLFATHVLSAPSPYSNEPTNSLSKRAPGDWTLVQTGTTGVAAMMMVVLNPTMVLFLDKVENNALKTPNGNPAWGALYNMNTNAITPLTIKTNTFCAGGGFLSNGTFVSTGGNGIISGWEETDGWQGIRTVNPCTSATGSGCVVNESPLTLHLLDQRWYPSVVRTYDGTLMVIGGSRAGGFYNDISNTASYEYFPKKFWMGQNFLVPSNFLERTVPANLFPIAFSLTDGKVFMAANNQTIMYDTDYNVETRLPDIPQGYRVTYPFTAGAVMLPLVAPSYTQTILICGGTNQDDRQPSANLSSQTPTSNYCWRMTLTSAGIAAGWARESMPDRRVMPDLVTVPTGDIVILNGAKTGSAGYGNFVNSVGQSNADQPAYRPVLYNPNAASGSRFTQTMMPTSSIPRMYHSVASLTPKGNILIAGSNPNADVINYTGYPYGTEYKIEYLNPPWMNVSRPAMTNPPAKMSFNTQYTFNVTVPTTLNSTASQIKVALMDVGFVTHSVRSTDRCVFLTATLASTKKSITVTGPRDGGIYPPGPGWLYFVVAGVVSEGKKVMIGTGGNPPVPYY